MEEERVRTGERVASNIQLIIRQTFLMNEELPIPPSSSLVPAAETRRSRLRGRRIPLQARG